MSNSDCGDRPGQESPNLVNVTAKIDQDIYRRFSAWCRLHGLKIADVLQEFMRDKGDQLSQVEDPKILFHKDTEK